MFNFDEWKQSRTQRVDSFLAEYLGPANPLPEVLREAMLYSLMAGGKRVRPLLTFGACEAIGGDSAVATAAAAAVECIHTYSLIHDDLPAMDDDDFRRGKPTSHKIFGEALAILAGDALQALAFAIVADHYKGETSRQLLMALAFAGGAGGMVGGQVFDLIADGRIKPGVGDKLEDDRKLLKKIHAMKTGALFGASVKLGMEVSAATSNPLYQNILKYAQCFGMAFQITDDLLDIQSDEATAGKKTGKDAKRGKLTYPGLIGIAASEAEAERFFREGLEAIEPFGERGEPLRHLLLSLRNRKK